MTCNICLERKIIVQDKSTKLTALLEPEISSSYSELRKNDIYDTVSNGSSDENWQNK